jgi:hypothetical protein
MGTGFGRCVNRRERSGRAGTELSGARSRGTRFRFFIRNFLAMAKVLKKDLECFNRGGRYGLCFAGGSEDELHTR